MPYTTKPRSSQQDYTPERRHFTQKNVSQVFAEDPKAKSTKEGLPTNPTYKSQEMGDILSGTPDHNNTTYRSPKKQVEPPKEREPATPGRKKVVDKPQGHGYEEILNPKPAPLEDRRVKKTQVGTLLENNEHPDTEALQEPPRSERKHFKTPIQPDENYFSEAKALAYDRRNNSRKVIIASDETPYSEKKCIDELASKLAKALGRKKPVPPPETPTLFTTNIKYDPHSNKKQVEYQPQKSKRGAASTPALPERKSVQTLSDVAARRLPEEENSAEAGSSRASSRAPSRATSSAAKQLFQYKENASTTHPSGNATSAEAAASSRKAGSEAGEKEAAMRLREENSAAKRAARLADNAQPGFDPSPKPRSNTSVTSAVAGSSRAPSVATSAAAGSSRATSRAASVAAAGLPSTPARAVRNAEDSEKLELRNKGLARKIKLQEYLDRVLGNGNVSAAPDRTDPLKERTKIIEEQVKKSKNLNNEIKLELQKLDNTKFMKRASDTGELTPNNRTASRSASLSGAASPGAEIQPAARPGAASSRSTSPGAPETGAPRAASPEAASLSEAASSRSSLSRSASVAAAGSSRSASPGAGMIILRGPRPPGYSSWQGNVTSPTSPGTNMTI